MSYKFLIEIVKYFLYVHCKVATWTLSFFVSFIDRPLYKEVNSIFNNLPYKVSEHYNEYPQLFALSGLLILISGISSIMRLSRTHWH
jgi:hypothetical protein